MKNRFLCLFYVLIFAFMPLAYSDYSQELQDQIKKLQRDYPQPRHEYFRDAGIIINKADDAGLYDLTAEWVRTLLFQKMDEYVKAEMDAINQLFADDPIQAGRRLQALQRLERYYEPSDEFLRTAQAQGLLTEIVQARENAMENFNEGCLDNAIFNGIAAVRKSGLFLTKNLKETEFLRKLGQETGCCVGWRRELHLKRGEVFKTDYEQGAFTEEGKLRLESSASDMSQARWAGEYIYKFTGREGQGQGVSTAVLVYHKGSEEANLKITPARMTSIGRMNFPHALSGENRTIEVFGSAMNPSFKFYQNDIPLTGCRAIPLSEDES